MFPGRNLFCLRLFSIEDKRLLQADMFRHHDLDTGKLLSVLTLLRRSPSLPPAFNLPLSVTRGLHHSPFRREIEADPTHSVGTKLPILQNSSHRRGGQQRTRVFTFSGAKNRECIRVLATEPKLELTPSRKVYTVNAWNLAPSLAKSDRLDPVSRLHFRSGLVRAIKRRRCSSNIPGCGMDHFYGMPDHKF